jgi:hypothetical protein
MLRSRQDDLEKIHFPVWTVSLEGLYTVNICCIPNIPSSAMLKHGRNLGNNEIWLLNSWPEHVCLVYVWRNLGTACRHYLLAQMFQYFQCLGMRLGLILS